MRNLIVLGVVGLALGLAVQNAPRVLGWGDAHAAGGGVGDVSLAAGGVEDGAIAAGSGARVRGAASAIGNARVSVAARPTARNSKIEAADTATIAPSDDNQSTNASSYTLASELTAERLKRLVEAGFSSERAEELLHKESQLRRAALESEYAATGTIRALNGAAPSAVATRLRKELGDEENARYLRALGEPTRIRVSAVDPDSVAANAGIQPGDEIISYAGHRVFNPRELSSLMLKTAEGETVPTTVIRDGQPLDLYVTGGPLGIAQRAVR